MLVVTYRPDDVALGRHGERHPLEPVVNELKRTYGDVWIDLEPTMGRRFIDAWLDTQPNRLSETFRAALHHQTEGHPLFTIELLRAMQERGDLVRDSEGNWVEGATLNWGRLPARVEAVVEERVGRLEAGLRNILAVASVEGETFTAHEERIKLYQQADRILVEDAAIVPVIYGQHQYLVKPWVRKLSLSAMIWNLWKDVIIEPHS